MFSLLENIRKDSLNFFVVAPIEEPYFSKLQQIFGIVVFPLNCKRAEI